MLAEAAALEHILEMQMSSYRPLADSCSVVIKEESKHIAHGHRIVKSLCKTDEGRRSVQEVLNRKWGQVLDLFGSSDSRRSLQYREWGLRRRSNDDARQDFIQKSRARLDRLGLVTPCDTKNRKFT
jgi:ring-1,2-phenylacetyl-CoA epoxidase subunit PaaA